MPETEQDLSPRTKLPQEMDEEQPFLSISEIKLSLRQMLTLVAGATVWFTLLSLTGSLFGLSTVFAGLVWSWVLILTVFFAVAKKDGMPYEEYIAQRIVFLISDRHFVLRDEKNVSQEIDETDWDRIEDPYIWERER